MQDQGRDRQRAALEDALARLPAARHRMKQIYGLELPTHLAHAVAWWHGLTPEEHEQAFWIVGGGPAGVGEWFDDGAFDRPLRPGLDERLEARFRRDPPELVTVFAGHSDGGHWGLWYDDPAELPRAVVHNYARDTAETHLAGATLLGALRASASRRKGRVAAAILASLAEAHAGELAAHEAENIPAFAPREDVLGGVGPWIDGAAIDLPDRDARLRAYQEESADVETWIARARSELQAGRPALALVLGRELHWLDHAPWREVSGELLIGGFRGFGRDALAEVVRMHHAHRDLRQASAYETNATRAEDAGKRADPDEIRKLARELPHDVAWLLFGEPPPAIVEAIIDGAGLEIVQLTLLAPWARDKVALRPLLLDLLARGVGGSAYAVALKLGDPELCELALAHLDLGWRDAKGWSVLHAAANVPSVAGVRALLARGCDARAADDRGKTAYDITRDAWIRDQKAASEIFDLLRAAGGAPTAPVAKVDPDTWANGVRVQHAKFGAGTVTAATGRGADAKLTIQFDDKSNRTLLAKFVTRS